MPKSCWGCRGLYAAAPSHGPQKSQSPWGGGQLSRGGGEGSGPAAHSRAISCFRHVACCPQRLLGLARSAALRSGGDRQEGDLALSPHLCCFQKHLIDEAIKQCYVSLTQQRCSFLWY